MKLITGIKGGAIRAGVGVLLLSLAWPANAVTIADKTLDDKAEVGKQQLLLNGAGLRRVFFFKVYIGALYLRQHLTTTEAVLADTGPKRIELYIMRHVDADEFMDAFSKAIKHNQTPEELKAISVRLEKFGKVFRAVGAVDEDTVVHLDYLPQPGVQSGETVVTIDGKERMRIEGRDFYAALLKVWLGKRPAQESLKEAMLGE